MVVGRLWIGIRVVIFKKLLCIFQIGKQRNKSQTDSEKTCFYARCNIDLGFMWRSRVFIFKHMLCVFKVGQETLDLTSLKVAHETLRPDLSAVCAGEMGPNLSA